MSKEEADCSETFSESASTTTSTMAYPGSTFRIRVPGDAPTSFNHETESNNFSEQFSARTATTMPTAAYPGFPFRTRMPGHVPASFYDETASNNFTFTGQSTMPGRSYPPLPHPSNRRIFPQQSHYIAETSPQHDVVSNYSDDPIVIVSGRSSRNTPDPTRANLSKERFLNLKQQYITLYIGGATEELKLEKCDELTSLDVDIKDKYRELDFQKLLNNNKIKRRINCLTQTLGILEKYASNLIKPNRPAFWRTVKFTSSLVKTYLENVQGSHDILKQMGYARPITDGLSFPDDVKVPDVERIKILAAELFLAKYETDELVHDKHPYLEILPATIFRVGGTVTSSLETGKPKITVAEPGTSESESEYEDAEDGLSATEPQIPASQQSVTVPRATETVSVTNDIQCHVCGESAEFSCEDCNESFCSSCVTTFHRRRPNHVTRRITSSRSVDAEQRERSPSPVLYENVGLRPTVKPREQKSDTRQKKPVPLPRKRIPSNTTGSATSIPPRQNELDELPPPPMPRRTTPEQTISRNVLKETVTQLPTAQAEREVKRPPPFDYNYVRSRDPLPTNEPADNDENAYQSLKTPSEHHYEALDLSKGDKVPEEDALPPPLPPRPGTQSSSVSVCPHCFCLNEKDVVKCVACGTKLREGQETTGLRSRIPTPGSRNTEIPVDNSAINLPVQSLRNPMNVPPGGAANIPYTPAGTVFAPGYPPGRPTPSGGAGFPGVTASTTSASKWQCEHCTFHNDMSTKICAVCYKTSDKPLEVPPAKAVGSKTSDKPMEAPPSNLTSPRSQTYIQLQEQELYSYSPKSPMEAPPSNLTSPRSQTYIQLQEKELYSYSSPMIPRPKLQKTEELLRKESATNFSQKVNETGRQIQSQKGSYSLAMVPDPHSLSQPYYTTVYSVAGQESPRVFNPYDEIYKMREEGQKFVQLLKKAETMGFAAEELNIACSLKHDDPIDWLRNEWFDRMQKVMNKFANSTKEEETLGNLSPQEAREALIEHTGYVDEACTQCLADRKKKLKEVMESGIYVRTDAIKALDEHDGNVEEAIQQLQRMTFEPMLQRIKDSCISANDAVDNRQQRLSNRRNSPTQEDEIFDAIVSNKEIAMDRRIRVMFAEKGFPSWGRAHTAIKLIDMNFPVSDSIEAAKANGDLERSIEYLQRECILCFEKKPENHMVTMLNCQCRFCKSCVSEFFNVVIHEQNIMKLVCPQCSEPQNLEDDAVATDYFNNLDIVIRQCVDSETHDLFQRKLRDRTLMKEPNFRWCSHCSSGFINEQPEALKMACPNCNKYTCFLCKKQWEDQHEGISCERFAAWKEANDPEAQANGLAAHLKQNGIECPSCKFRYDLAKGGCMHFKCGQCSHEFCSGCYKPFRHSQHCHVSPDCARRGLHAHHPRDCLFYLRDRDPEELEKLLDDHNVEYNTEPPQRQVVGEDNQGFEENEEVQGAAAAAAVNTGRCKVMEQRESGAGLEDAECGRETPAGYAGLCRLHFIEYLVERINSNLIDPVGILSTDDLLSVLRRNDLEPPVKTAREKDNVYHKRLVKYVQEKLPLPKKSPRKRVLDVEEQPQPAIGDQMENLRLIDLEVEDGAQVEWGYESDLSDEPDFGYNDSGAEQSD